MFGSKLMKFLIKFLNNLMLIAITAVHMVVVAAAFLTTLVFISLSFMSKFLSDVRRDLRVPNQTDLKPIEEEDNEKEG
jgi:hypothetical protein